VVSCFLHHIKAIPQAMWLHRLFTRNHFLWREFHILF